MSYNLVGRIARRASLTNRSRKNSPIRDREQAGPGGARLADQECENKANTDKLGRKSHREKSLCQLGSFGAAQSNPIRHGGRCKDVLSCFSGCLYGCVRPQSLTCIRSRGGGSGQTEL